MLFPREGEAHQGSILDLPNRSCRYTARIVTRTRHVLSKDLVHCMTWHGSMVRHGYFRRVNIDLTLEATGFEAAQELLLFDALVAGL